MIDQSGDDPAQEGRHCFDNTYSVILGILMHVNHTSMVLYIMQWEIQLRMVDQLFVVTQNTTFKSCKIPNLVTVTR